MPRADHLDLIRDQFTRQAVPFSTAKTIADERALRLLVAFSDANPGDRVLDVACGGGNVVCAFAPVVDHATGIDVTPAMLERAQTVANARGLENVSWDLGDVTSLPYPDATFTLVVTRFSFHHFPDPAVVLREMIRVCVPGGRVVVVDMHASEDPDKAAEFNRMEKLRDPSHVRALSRAELHALFSEAGLRRVQETAYELRDELENLLARSFPNPGDDAHIRQIFRAAAADDRLGLEVRLEGERVHYAYPVAVLAATRMT
jgi:ubiquinone/menaquinone biosynthesis C-methylase UbiE